MGYNKKSETEGNIMRRYKFSELRGRNDFEYTPDDDIKINSHYYGMAEPLHGHDYYELEYIYEGSGIQIINGVSYPVETGSVIVLNPNDSHSYYSIQDMKIYNCCFSSPDKLMHYFDTSKPSIVLLDEFFRIEIEQLFYLLETELLQRKKLYLETAWVILDLIMMTVSRSKSNEIYSDPVWGKIFTYITENIDTVSLNEISNIMGVSESYFCRAFKKNFSVTFHQYVVNVRMQMAKSFLSYSKMSIAEIADAVGYNSECCFFQDFKKSVGTTPQKYRKSIMNNSKDLDLSFTKESGK